jgi:hypothetical protein
LHEDKGEEKGPEVKQPEAEHGLIRSSRTWKPSMNYLEMVQAYAHSAVKNDPVTCKQALSRRKQEADEWRAAIEEEHESLIKNDTWKIVDRPKGQNVIKGRYVLRTKYKDDGTILKRKARYVAKGFTQQQGIDYDEVFAPVVKYHSLRTMLAMAAHKKMKLFQMDVNTAFLQGELTEDNIFMELPEMLKTEENKGEQNSKVCKLNKAIYGLKQASRVWNKKLDTELKSIGFSQSESDPCVYIMNQGSDTIFLLVYVDDLMAASTSDKIWIKIKDMLKQRFDMKDLGELKWCLGMSVEKKDDVVTLSQEKYINDLLEKYQMNDCKPSSTPMEQGCILQVKGAEEASADAELYRSIVGSLLYVMTSTRPDIAFAVNQVSKYMQAPGQAHLVAAKRTYFALLEGNKRSQAYLWKKFYSCGRLG